MTRATADVIPAFEITIEKDSLVLWAAILHDPNPIHLDAGFVQVRNWGPAEINQGPANLAYVINALAQAFPEGMIESLDIQFLNNVFVGETVAASGKILRIEEGAGSRRTFCEVWLTPKDRAPVLAGQAVVRHGVGPT